MWLLVVSCFHHFACDYNHIVVYISGVFVVEQIYSLLAVFVCFLFSPIGLWVLLWVLRSFFWVEERRVFVFDCFVVVVVVVVEML